VTYPPGGIGAAAGREDGRFRDADQDQVGWF